jgi:hypothetical protein
MSAAARSVCSPREGDGGIRATLDERNAKYAVPADCGHPVSTALLCKDRADAGLYSWGA